MNASRLLLVFAALVVSGCVHVRFVDRPIEWDEHDDTPIAKPAEHPVTIEWNGMRDAVFQPIDRVLSLDYGVEASNVNALDEVPDSSWFRDPRRESPELWWKPRALSPKEMAWGAATVDDVPVPPLTVVKGKAIGSSAGFVVKDARGLRFAIKMDPPRRAYFATSVEVVVSRLAWACGWRVPAEVMIELRPDQFKVEPGAKQKDYFRRTIPFTEEDLTRMLDAVPRLDDGTLLVLASRWLPGEPIGPYQYAGRRPDDPNDRFLHQNRRDLRGFGVFAAWVNDIDMLENNTLDVYEGPPGRGHVVHYQQDVGGAFANWAVTTMDYWMGHETYFDVPHILRAFFSLGFASGDLESAPIRAEHDARAHAFRALASFSADRFDPRTWRAILPIPTNARQTARDRYWAAKRIAFISDVELRAAITAGHYPQAVADELFNILWARRDKVLRAYLGDLTALDHVHFNEGALCFEDLWLRAGLGSAARYAAKEGRAQLLIQPSVGNERCVSLPARSGYRVVSLSVERPGLKTPRPLRVHLIDRRVIGLER